MKKPILLFGLCLLISNAFSQTRISVAGGIHSTSVSPFFNSDTTDLSSTELKRSSLHFGLIADLPVNNSKRLSLQTGILFFSRGTTQEVIKDTSKGKIFRATTEQKINYIDLPFNMVYKMPLKGKTSFIIGAGPQASLFYSGSSTYSTVDTINKFSFEENKDLPVGKGNGQYKVAHFAVNALIGFEFKKVYLTANYNKSLTPFYEQTNKFNHSSLGLTLGIFLGKTISTKNKVETITDNDLDKDGISNEADQCPDVAGGRATNGCPDKDADGIMDGADRCPDVAGTARNNGCPVLDKDSDGILDEADKCIDVPGTLKYNGCPIPDTDGDGINNEEDSCQTEVGPKENNGCPEIRMDVIEKVNFSARQISFKVGSDILTTPSLKVLDEIIVRLKENPELNITVEGHSSLDGIREANLLLSQKRAERVKQYMMTNGIDEQKIKAIGFGVTRPLTEEKTEKANMMNRRVEIKLAR